MKDEKELRWAGSSYDEIRIRDITGIYRVMYVAKFEEAIQATSRYDKDIAEARYRAVVNARKVRT